MIVYKTTDQVPVKIGKLTFWLSPLSAKQKLDLMETSSRKGGVETVNNVDSAFKAMTYSIKAVDGLKNSDGSDFKVDLDESGCMKEECLDAIIGLECQQKIAEVCVKIIQGIHKIKVPGAEIDLGSVRTLKKK
jgi:hypothetical protein